MSKELGAMLRQYRNNCEFTQQQIADVLKIDRSTYSYYETGKTEPSLATISQLARIFNISPAALLCEYDENGKILCVADSAIKRPKQKDFTSTKAEKIYDLSDEEKTLMINFRLANGDKKKELLEKSKPE